MAMSLIASTRGVALLPAYAQNFLPWSVTSRPLKGEAPTIDLVLGYNQANQSPILKLLTFESGRTGRAGVKERPVRGPYLRARVCSRAFFP